MKRKKVGNSDFVSFGEIVVDCFEKKVGNGIVFSIFFFFFFWFVNRIFKGCSPLGTKKKFGSEFLCPVVCISKKKKKEKKNSNHNSMNSEDIRGLDFRLASYHFNYILRF